MSCTAIDSVGCDPSAPFNSRELIEIALGVGVEYRKSSHAFLRRFCVMTWGEQALSVQINHYWVENMVTCVLDPIPYHLKYWFCTAKIKRSGVPVCALSNSRFSRAMRGLRKRPWTLFRAISDPDHLRLHVERVRCSAVLLVANLRTTSGISSQPARA